MRTFRLSWPFFGLLVTCFGQVPPSIVATNVRNGARDINPGTTEIVIRFDQRMRQAQNPLVASNDATDPHFGAASLDRSGMVFTVPVRLQPEHDYEFATSEALRSASGVPVDNRTVRFRTTRPWADKRFVTPREGLVYGQADGVKLTMDYYAPAGKGPHPVAIIVHGGGFVAGTSRNGSEAYCADFLAPAGYAVFSINYRLYPRFTLRDMVDDVHRAVRFIRHNAHEWEADPARIALVGGSAGGYLSNMAPLVGTAGDPKAKDPVDRESAAVQAVVTLFGPSELGVLNWQSDRDPLLGGWSITEASPITHVNRSAPPFLLIHGDKDEAVPIDQSIRMQKALKQAGVRADLIVIPNGPHATGSWYRVPGVPDWEKQMTEWLNGVLHHQGPVGEGIRPRTGSAQTTH